MVNDIYDSSIHKELTLSSHWDGAFDTVLDNILVKIRSGEYQYGKSYIITFKDDTNYRGTVILSNLQSGMYDGIYLSAWRNEAPQYFRYYNGALTVRSFAFTS